MKNFVCNIIVNDRELSIIYDKLASGVYCHYEHYNMADDDMARDMNVYFDEFYPIIFDNDYDSSLSILHDPENYYKLNIAQVQNWHNVSDKTIERQLKLFRPYIEKWIDEQLEKPPLHQMSSTTQLFWKHGRTLTEKDKAKIAEILE